MFGSKTLCVLLAILTVFFFFMAFKNLMMGAWLWVVIDVVIGLLMLDSTHNYYQQTPWTFADKALAWLRNLRK